MGNRMRRSLFIFSTARERLSSMSCEFQFHILCGVCTAVMEGGRYVLKASQVRSGAQ
jgi:hypothetical protein